MPQDFVLILGCQRAHLKTVMWKGDFFIAVLNFFFLFILILFLLDGDSCVNLK